VKSAQEIWETAKGALQVQINKANYETWLKDTVGISHRRNQFIIGTPKAFAKEWLEQRLHSLIRKTLMGIIGHDVDVQFQVCALPDGSVDEAEASHGGPYPLQRRLPLPKLNPRYTFDSFIVGNSNRLAYAAAMGVAEEPGHEHNPLFIYGDSGLGKTHLVHAIGNDACEEGLNVAYASGEQFTNEFVDAIRQKTTDQFRAKFRSVDLLILEDIQFIIGKQQTQMTLFHTFDELHNGNRQLVVTGNRPPGSMVAMEKELCSRLSCGLVTRIRPPDVDTRLSILRSKAHCRRVEIDDDVFQYVADRCQTNVRELEGILNRLLAYARMAGKEFSLDMAKEALEALQQTTAEARPVTALTPVSILNAVADHFNVTVESLRGRKRDSRLVLARQIAIYLVREKTNYPLQDIGKLLGGRDHSTITRGYQRMSGMVTEDSGLQRNIDQILKRLPG